MRWFVAATVLVAINWGTGSAVAQDCAGDPIEGFICNPFGESVIGSVFSASAGLSRRALSLALIEESLDEEGEAAGGGASADDRGFGVFVNGLTAFKEIDQERELGSDSDTFGASVGTDYRADAFVLGLAVDYLNEDIDLDRDAGTSDIDEFGIQLFGIAYPIGNFYVAGAARFAYNDYDTDRTIESDTGDRTSAKGDTHGNKISAVGSVGYDVNLPGGVIVGLSESLEFERTHIDSYKEKDASPLDFSGGTSTTSPNLRYEDDDKYTLTSVLELNGAKAFSVPWGVLVPEAVFRYLHEFEDDPRNITARVVDLPEGSLDSRVRFRTNKPDRDYFNVGAAVTSVFQQGWALFVDYHAVVGHSFREEHVVNFGVRTDFDSLRSLF